MSARPGDLFRTARHAFNVAAGPLPTWNELASFRQASPTHHEAWARDGSGYVVVEAHPWHALWYVPTATVGRRPYQRPPRFLGQFVALPDAFGEARAHNAAREPERDA